MPKNRIFEQLLAMEEATTQDEGHYLRNRLGDVLLALTSISGQRSHDSANTLLIDSCADPLKPVDVIAIVRDGADHHRLMFTMAQTGRSYIRVYFHNGSGLAHQYLADQLIARGLRIPAEEAAQKVEVWRSCCLDMARNDHLSALENYIVHTLFQLGIKPTVDTQRDVPKPSPGDRECAIRSPATTSRSARGRSRSQARATRSA